MLDLKTPRFLRLLKHRDPPDVHEASSPTWMRSVIRKSHALYDAYASWYVVAAESEVDAPRRFRVDGRDLVAWKHDGQSYVGDDRCPHMGASLDGARRDARGAIVCPWHGMRLCPGRGEGSAFLHGASGWRTYPTHADGRFLWVWLGDGAQAAPPHFERPAVAHAIDAFMHVDARCDPDDVLENRLDPWHAVPFHPHSFASLRVVRREETRVIVRVAYRIGPGLSSEVLAHFSVPGPRTIVMRIVEGEGEGSIVETHATPMAPGLTRIHELVCATSSRPGFIWALRAQQLLRPLLAARARRLWKDDVLYVERRAALRQASETAPSASRRGRADTSAQRP